MTKKASGTPTMYMKSRHLTKEGCVLGFLVCLYVVSISSNDATNFHKQLPAHVVWALSGSHAELPCDITPPGVGDRVNMVLWFKDGTGVPLYSLDAREGDLLAASHLAISTDLGARAYFQAVGPGPTRLRVNNVSLLDEGVFRCRVDFLNSPTRNFRVNLTIIVPPSEPVIYDFGGKEVTGIAGPFLEGYEMFLACHVIGGKPAPEVTWWIDGGLLDATVDSSSGGRSVNQLLISVPRSFHGRRVECRARSSNLAPPVTKAVSLDIFLKPRTVAIVNDNILLSAGKLQQVQCVTSGSVPPARLQWLLDGEPIRGGATLVKEVGNSTSCTLTFRPAAADNEKDLVCRAENPRFPGGLREARRRLRVAYPPIVFVQLHGVIDLSTLREGDDVQFLCDVRANPEPDSITWYHSDRPLQWSELEGVFPEGRTLRLSNLRRESAGDYCCAASNREGQVRSGPVRLRVQFAPRCRKDFASRQLGARRHETILVRCEVDADPVDVRFRWTYNRSREVLPVPTERVNSSGGVSEMRYKPVSAADFGTLACWGTNNAGQQREPCLVHVVQAKPPSPPVDCQLRNLSSGALELSCSPGWDGLLTQHFMLEVLEGDLPLYENRAANPRFELRTLQPGRDYTLAVYGVNSVGRSTPPVLLPNVRVATAVERLTGGAAEDEDDVQPTPVVLAVLIGSAALILVGICVTAVMVVCHRRSAPPKQLPPPTLYHDEMMNMMVAVPSHVKPTGGRPLSQGFELQELALGLRDPDLIVSRTEAMLHRPPERTATVR